MHNRYVYGFVEVWRHGGTAKQKNAFFPKKELEISEEN
jgi:hypothetical protein